MSWLLFLYPKAWRKRYGVEFIDVLQARPIGIRTVVDVVRGAADARLRSGRSGGSWLVGLTLLGTLVVGWLNYSASDDVQPVAAALLVFSFAAALMLRSRLWWPVLVLWIAVPLSGAVADAMNHHPGVAKPAPLYETLIALIFPILGAALGTGTRWVWRVLRES